MSGSPVSEQSFWNTMAGRYATASSFTERFAERAIELAALPRGARVLDIATGNGALAAAAARAGARVLATDFSAGMVERVAALGIPGIEAQRMDGQALDLPDASFDAAFSMFGVMLFPDWRAGLSEMARVLRAGGIGCVGTWKDPAGAGPNLLLSRVCTVLFPEIEPRGGPAGMLEFSDPDRFRSALAHVGFRDVRIAEVASEYVLELSLLDAPDEVFPFSPLWPELDVDRRRAALHSIRRHPWTRGSVILIPSIALVATGTRF